MFGWIYELGGIKFPSEARKGADLFLWKVPHARWPQGITLNPYAYAITIGGCLTVPRAMIGGADVKVSFDPEQQEFHLTSVIGYRGPGMLIERREQMAVAKAGDLLNLGDVQIRIVSVVPPNTEQHTPGLGGIPLPLAGDCPIWLRADLGGATLAALIATSSHQPDAQARVRAGGNS